MPVPRLIRNLPESKVMGNLLFLHTAGQQLEDLQLVRTVAGCLVTTRGRHRTTHAQVYHHSQTPARPHPPSPGRQSLEESAIYWQTRCPKPGQ